MVGWRREAQWQEDDISLAGRDGSGSTPRTECSNKRSLNNLPKHGDPKTKQTLTEDQGSEVPAGLLITCGFVEALPMFTQLTFLNLSNNDLQDELAAILAVSLKAPVVLCHRSIH